MRFKGKVVLVTGGTTGIGRETAILLARQGARVAITGRREAQGAETVALIEKADGEAIFIKANAENESDCRRMVDETISRFGRLDAAFNNAGIEGDFAPVEQQEAENFHRVMNINVLGVLLSMKYQIPAIRRSGGGAIVNNASVAGTIGMPTGSVYIASKHAVIGLTKSAALEVARENIRINSVSPGAIQTDMWDRFTGSDATKQEYMIGLHPVGRAGKPSEIADAVAFLCSDEATFITGTNLQVDGGFTAQ
ncbi:MAG: SDR family oxidoreductase [Deltaproteobacteria bacterium]|nr:SDR family oxidoreductase [Deltaproteobacteria bacterium]